MVCVHITICTLNFFNSLNRTGPHQKSHFLCNVICVHVFFSHWFFSHSRLVSLVHGPLSQDYHFPQFLFSVSQWLVLLNCWNYLARNWCLFGQFFSSWQLISRNHQTSRLSMLFAQMQYSECTTSTLRIHQKSSFDAIFWINRVLVPQWNWMSKVMFLPDNTHGTKDRPAVKRVTQSTAGARSSSTKQELC